jgi:hypothetical protein
VRVSQAYELDAHPPDNGRRAADAYLDRRILTACCPGSRASGNPPRPRAAAASLRET